MKKVVFSVILLGAGFSAFSQSSAGAKAEQNCVKQTMAERNVAQKAFGSTSSTGQQISEQAAKRDCQYERVTTKPREYNNKYNPSKGSKQK